jgi:hypothetical protein
MSARNLLGGRTTAVVAGAAVLVSLGGVSGAVAGRMITSEQIKNGQVHKADVGDGAVGGREVANGTLGLRDLNDSTQGKITTKTPATKYDGEHWGIVDRNVIGNGDAYLRSGPYSWDGAGPPMGIGSLGLRTGSGSDKVAFGNEVDFQGDDLGELNTLKYSVFTTGENKSADSPTAGNLPNLQFEIAPDGSSGFSTLVFVPKPVDEGKWTEIDASTDPQWYLTGATGVQNQCTQATMCSLDQVLEKLPDAKIYTAQINKGRDNAFSGAVDDLVINDKAYDFEPFGVTTK